MFDWSEITELDGNAVADALAESRQRVIEAEAEQFMLAAHWADLHAAPVAADQRRVLAGMEQVKRAGAHGCPDLAEFAGAELAALLGRSTASGEALLTDSVNIRFRHPLMWRAIQDGTARVWLASKVARRCAAERLTLDQAIWVDAHTTPYVSTLPPGRFLDLVEARIIEADPHAAAERAEARALHQFVHAGARDEAGMRTLVARASAGDVVYLVAVLDRLAEILAAHGDDRSADLRRVAALRILANPARALALLTGAELAPTEGGDQVLVPALDQEGLPLHDLPEVALTAPEDPEPPVDDLRPRLIAALESFDASRLDPVVVLQVHLTDAALGATVGVARVEGIGPLVLDAVRDWLTDPWAESRVELQPVADADAIVAVDRYEFPDRMSDVASIRNPFEVFPFGTLPSRSAENDHAIPYIPGRPGQTGLHNLAKLGRRHHRMKTHGAWVLRHPSPGVYWWRAPHGHWFVVGPMGTQHHGRDPALDAQVDQDTFTPRTSSDLPWAIWNKAGDRRGCADVDCTAV